MDIKLDEKTLELIKRHVNQHSIEYFNLDTSDIPSVVFDKQNGRFRTWSYTRSGSQCHLETDNYDEALESWLSLVVSMTDCDIPEKIEDHVNWYDGYFKI
jgi:hypothetical protein